MSELFAAVLALIGGVIFGVAACPETVYFNEYEQAVEMCFAHNGVTSVTTRHQIYIKANCKDGRSVEDTLTERKHNK